MLVRQYSDELTPWGNPWSRVESMVVFKRTFQLHVASLDSAAYGLDYIDVERIHSETAYALRHECQSI